jgi:hypothetical protein
LYKEQGKEVDFLIDGISPEKNIDVEELDYSNFKGAYIMNTTPNKYIFVFAQKK